MTPPLITGEDLGRLPDRELDALMAEVVTHAQMVHG